MKTRLEEVNDLLKSAKWNATGGYDCWVKHNGYCLPLKCKLDERNARIEAYVKLRIEQYCLGHKISNL